jgi:hypothetical protein
MAKTLTARLDERSEEELAKLAKTLGKTESEIVRDGIHLMATTYSMKSLKKSQFFGMGEFTSGLKDLASNKKHLGSFGK